MEPDARLAELLLVLERARTVGFLGPGPLRAQVEHAAAFTAALPPHARRLVDLGSGGGLPALPVLLARPDLEGVLIEAMHKRATFLAWAVGRLALSERVSVRRERAEVAGHAPGLRGTADVVTARGFAPPAVTAECAVGFLRLGGVLIVSEPPEPADRWPADSLAELGLSPAQHLDRVVRMELVRTPEPSRPRTTAALVKRPLF